MPSVLGCVGRIDRSIVRRVELNRPRSSRRSLSTYRTQSGPFRGASTGAPVSARRISGTVTHGFTGPWNPSAGSGCVGRPEEVGVLRRGDQPGAVGGGALHEAAGLEPVGLAGGIPVSEHFFAWRTTTTARLTDDAEAMGNDLDPVLCTVGPATAHRRPHAIQLLGRLFPTDLPSPAGPTFRLSATELLPFRERVQDGIGMPGAMAAVARPGRLARVGHHRGPHRVGLDGPQNDEQVVAVLDDRGSEAALPEDFCLPVFTERPKLL